MANRSVYVLPGDVFSRLTVIKEADLGKWKERRVDCICQCGVKINTGLHSMRYGLVTSCGCFFRERTKARNRTHGLTDSLEYKTWCSAKRRCNSTTSPDYPAYGGRGISMHREWVNSFACFLAYVGNRPTPSHSLDRFPNRNGNYEPGNVRWATPEQQAQNKDCTKVVCYNGQTRLLIDVCRETGIAAGTARNRLRKGWPEHLMFIPTMQHGRNRKLDGYH